MLKDDKGLTKGELGVEGREVCRTGFNLADQAKPCATTDRRADFSLVGAKLKLVLRTVCRTSFSLVKVLGFIYQPLDLIVYLNLSPND